MSKTILKGITWGHSRGITPLLAFSQRFTELYPDTEVVWDKRSLQQFADYPIEKLALDYDLLIVDHPWVGCAAATGCVLPLDEYFTETYLAEQLRNSTGLSHISYKYDGHQWALAIDAATPVASYRNDLLLRHQVSVPQTWDEILALAKDGKIAVPGIPIDILMNFYMFCIAHGKEPFQNDEEVVDKQIGIAAMETMRDLYQLVDTKMFACNPIAVAELLGGTDDYWYCPFAYGYSNYSRKGYAQHLVSYTDLAYFNNKRFRSTLGGTGLSVSATSKHKEQALLFTKMIVSGKCQSGLYVEHGGQPGHRTAWVNADVNNMTNNFFSQTLPVLERAYMRPRYNGYLHFQDLAGNPLQHYLMHGGNPENVLQEMNSLYKKSPIKQSTYSI